MALKLSVLDQAPVSAGSTPAAALRHSIELARLAERLGYTRYWIAEHHGMQIIATSAPEILVGLIAQATRRIRVGAGAVLLPYYPAYKVAEVFRTLHALFPDRIDLGIGRGPGAGAAAMAALWRHREPARFTLEHFPEQLLELCAFLEGGFPPQHPLARLRVQPEAPGAPPVWLVGATPWGSAGAGALGLPYVFAHFIGPQHTRAAIAAYRNAFRPTARRRQPYAALAIGVLCAESEAEAERLAASSRAVASRPQSTEGWVPPVEEALRELAASAATGAGVGAGAGVDVGAAAGAGVGATAGAGAAASPGGGACGEPWPRAIVGSPRTVKARLCEIAARLQLDEIMVLTTTYEHAARCRSYELLAQVFELTPG